MDESDIEITIKLWGKVPEDYLMITNGSDENHVYLVTDLDQRQIEINIDDLKLALRKISCK